MRGLGTSARIADRKAKFASAIAIATCVLLGAPAMAAATDITVNDDTSGPGPAGADCGAPDHATITAAVAAASASGDRILVCAGTYTQPQILIDKSLDLIGAGAGASIIDGGNAAGMPSAGLIRTNDNTNGDVLVQDFTVQNVGATGGGTSAAIAPKGNDLGATQDFNRIELIGEGTGGGDYGMWADNADPDVILRNSSITGTDFNPILLERVDGAVTVRDNVIAKDPVTASSAIFTMVYSGDSTTNPLRIVDNDIDAQGSSAISFSSTIGTPATINSVEVRRNSISDFGALGVAVTNADPGASGVAGEISNVDISGNAFAGRTLDAGVGIRLRGRVRNVNISSNTLTDLATGIAIESAASGHSPTGVTAHFNRIAGNATAGLSAVAADPVDAEHNWWGCNEGPGAAGCDAVSAETPVDFDPWLILGLNATPTTIDARGDTSTLVADLTGASDEGDAGPGFPEATPIGFSTNLGTVQTPIPTAAGTATSTLASGNVGGTADVAATLDNETATAQVVINPPPVDPRETEPDPAPADLELSVTPKRRVIAGGGTVGYSVTVRNDGQTRASGVVLCARVPRKLSLADEPCVDVGNLAPGRHSTTRYLVSAPDIPKRTFRVKFTTKGTDAAAAKARAKLQVRN